MRPSCRLADSGRFSAPGMCPATGSIGSKLAAEALRRPRIDQPAGRLAQARLHVLRGGHPALVERPGVVARHDHRRRSVQGQSQRLPRGHAAVEHRHVAMAHGTQQPPEPRRRHRAVAGVIGHHLRAGRHAQPRQRAVEIGRLGQRMPAQRRGLAVVGEIAVQVSVARARQVRAAPCRLAGIGISQHVAAVHQHQARRGPARRPGRGGTPSWSRAHGACSRRRRKFTSIAAVAPQMRWPS